MYTFLIDVTGTTPLQKICSMMKAVQFLWNCVPIQIKFANEEENNINITLIFVTSIMWKKVRELCYVWVLKYQTYQNYYYYYYLSSWLVELKYIILELYKLTVTNITFVGD